MHKWVINERANYQSCGGRATARPVAWHLELLPAALTSRRFSQVRLLLQGGPVVGHLLLARLAAAAAAEAAAAG